MAYTTNENSVDSAAPIELYEFRGLDGTAYRFTSSPVDVKRGAFTYRSETVKRGALKAGSQDGDQHVLEIELPATTQMVADYATQISPPKLDLTIYRYHDGDDPLNDAVIYWLGPVVTFKLSGNRAFVRSSSIFGSALGGNIPSVYFQSPCNWVLYDAQCRVNRSLFEFSTTPTAVGANTVEIPSIPAQFTPATFLGGEIQVPRTGERRMIIGVNATIFSVNYPFSDIKSTDDINIAAGCDHAFSTCKAKFNNAINFGGDRFIPWVNPFAEGID